MQTKNIVFIAFIVDKVLFKTIRRQSYFIAAFVGSVFSRCWHLKLYIVVVDVNLWYPVTEVVDDCWSLESWPLSHDLLWDSTDRPPIKKQLPLPCTLPPPGFAVTHPTNTTFYSRSLARNHDIPLNPNITPQKALDLKGTLGKAPISCTTTIHQ